MRAVPGVVKLIDAEWHCRQSVLTLLTFRRRGFGEPCGEWQLTHPSVLTTGCS